MMKKWATTDGYKSQKDFCFSISQQILLFALCQHTDETKEKGANATSSRDLRCSVCFPILPLSYGIRSLLIASASSLPVRSISTLLEHQDLSIRLRSPLEEGLARNIWKINTRGLGTWNNQAFNTSGEGFDTCSLPSLSEAQTTALALDL
jgi:hypothetical protein